MSKPKVIAFYLPQYHPTPNNDKWWGKGFTEWTNVGKAKPLFKGHYQPKVPADLGYYDLRLPEVREAQAELAREAGIYGFCYYHYWFGNGREELELPFNEVLKSGKPDFPFMLCWANESWHKKFWNNDAKGNSKEVLVEQTYPGEEDHINHFYRLLPAFKDHRYIRIEDKPAFMIYQPLKFPDIKKFTELWRNLAIKEGLNGIFFLGHVQLIDEIEEISNFKEYGLDGVNTALIWYARQKYYQNRWHYYKLRFYRRFFKRNVPIKYKDLMPFFHSHVDNRVGFFPTLIPNWDHSPRSGKDGYCITGATPELFKKHVEETLALLEKNKNPILFLKSWNEWGEGNYMEPDLKYGKGYIHALAQALNSIK